MMSLPQTSRRSQFIKLLVVIFVLAIAAFTAIPNYFTHQWLWKQPPEIATQSELKLVQQQGLTLPGWKTLDQQVTVIGGNKWSFQAIESETPSELPADSQKPSILLLRPQTYYKDQPQVEWMDINGAQRWTADRITRLTFTVPATAPATAPATTPSTNDGTSANSTTQISARFLRGWNRDATYAVLQWYAWPTGGHPAPSHWFWADQLRQLGDRHRMPWVAVNLMIPIKPLGEIETVRPIAESLAQTVQAALMADALKLDS
jgi:cyanoexosortase B-associated protein